MTEQNYNADKFDSNPDPDVDTSTEAPAPHDVYETGYTSDGAETNTYLAPPLSARKDEAGNVTVDSDEKTYPSHENVFSADEHVFDKDDSLVNKDADSEHDDKSFHPVPEGLGEHREGESLKEWLANDLEQTKKDLHIGHDK